jgi:hypothetical protein
MTHQRAWSLLKKLTQVLVRYQTLWGINTSGTIGIQVHTKTALFSPYSA